MKNTVIEDCGAWLKIDVSSKTHPTAVMFIDKEDFLITNRRVCIAQVNTNKRYAVFNEYIGNRKNKLKYIHRELCSGDIIDHIDGNSLNNRKENLRAVSHSANLHNTQLHKHNTSGTKGVQKFGNMWRAYITVSGKTHYLGVFAQKQEACAARKQAENKYLHSK